MFLVFRSATLLQMRLLHRWFFVNFEKFLRAPLLQDTFGLLLLLLAIGSKYLYWSSSICFFLFHFFNQSNDFLVTTKEFNSSFRSVQSFQTVWDSLKVFFNSIYIFLSIKTLKRQESSLDRWEESEHSYFTPCSSVSIVNFERVIAGWAIISEKVREKINRGLISDSKSFKCYWKKPTDLVESARPVGFHWSKLLVQILIEP